MQQTRNLFAQRQSSSMNRVLGRKERKGSCDVRRVRIHWWESTRVVRLCLRSSFLSHLQPLKNREIPFKKGERFGISFSCSIWQRILQVRFAWKKLFFDDCKEGKTRLYLHEGKTSRSTIYEPADQRWKKAWDSPSREIRFVSWYQLFTWSCYQFFYDGDNHTKKFLRFNSSFLFHSKPCDEIFCCAAWTKMRNLISVISCQMIFMALWNEKKTQ